MQRRCARLPAAGCPAAVAWHLRRPHQLRCAASQRAQGSVPAPAAPPPMPAQSAAPRRWPRTLLLTLAGPGAGAPHPRPGAGLPRRRRRRLAPHSHPGDGGGRVWLRALAAGRPAAGPDARAGGGTAPGAAALGPAALGAAASGAAAPGAAALGVAALGAAALGAGELGAAIVLLFRGMVSVAGAAATAAHHCPWQGMQVCLACGALMPARWRGARGAVHAGMRSSAGCRPTQVAAGRCLCTCQPRVASDSLPAHPPPTHHQHTHTTTTRPDPADRGSWQAGGDARHKCGGLPAPDCLGGMQARGAWLGGGLLGLNSCRLAAASPVGHGRRKKSSPAWRWH